jgi:glycosyltransferase involved in cell wall biosynthesis
MTSVHPRDDIRIFVKECISLSRHGYNVSLVVADGGGDELKNGVQIIDAGIKSGSRISRMTKTVKNVFNKAIELNGDVYHFHDPELIPVALKLKKKFKKIVIYDVHEDVPKQILLKDWIPKLLRRIISLIVIIVESYAVRKLDFVIAATPNIQNRFKKLGINSVDINNYPLPGELDKNSTIKRKDIAVCYIGGLTKIRGIKELVEAMNYVDGKLYLAGEFNEPGFKSELESMAGWKNVKYYGYLSRSEVADLMARCKAGVVTFHPAPNHVDAQPNKMFEYMSAGLPVIASDFPLWEEIIEGSECGICVDPQNPEDIADSIQYLIDNSQHAEQMGKNGIKAVKKKYNWDIENKKLINIYENIL